MEAIRIKKLLDSDTIYLPDAKDMIGKMVKIIILEEPQQNIDTKKRIPGSAKGMMSISDDFEAPLDDDTVKDFYE